jgi:hypothetical protein
MTQGLPLVGLQSPICELGQSNAAAAWEMSDVLSISEVFNFQYMYVIFAHARMYIHMRNCIYSYSLSLSFFLSSFLPFFLSFVRSFFLSFFLSHI